MAAIAIFFDARREIRLPAGPIHSACRHCGLARAHQLGQISLEITGYLANLGFNEF
jgi:hypothetical protein